MYPAHAIRFYRWQNDVLLAHTSEAYKARPREVYGREYEGKDMVYATSGVYLRPAPASAGTLFYI